MKTALHGASDTTAVYITVALTLSLHGFNALRHR